MSIKQITNEPIDGYICIYCICKISLVDHMRDKCCPECHEALKKMVHMQRKLKFVE